MSHRRPPLRVSPGAGVARRGALSRLRELGIDSRMVGPGVPADLCCVDADHLRAAAPLLVPVHDRLDPMVTGDLAAAALERARIGGRLYGVPRAADVRIWWARRDRAPDSTATWSQLALSALPVAIPTTGRALSELFFEVLASHGGAILDRELRAVLSSPEAEEALGELARIASGLPEPGGLPDRRVIDRLALGRAVAGPLWWSQTAVLTEAPAYQELDPAPVPSGPYASRAWLRVTVWAVPRTCQDLDTSLDALVRLCGPAAAAFDDAAGVAPASDAALVPRATDDASQARARVIAADTLAARVLRAPPIARLPELLEAVSAPIASAVLGDQSVTRALVATQEAADAAVG